MAANVSKVTVAGPTALQRYEHRSTFYYAGQWTWRFIRTKPLGVIGALILIGLVFIAVFAGPNQIGPRVGIGPAAFDLPFTITTPGISPYDPLKVDPPAKLSPPSGEHLMGTDQLGRDMLSRIFHGARISLQVGLAAVFISTVVGSIIGMTTGYFRGAWDMLAQRVIDAIQSFPFLVLAMAIVAVRGSSLENVIIALGIVFSPSVARVIRGATLSVAQNQYIEATRAVGSGPGRIIFFHILPNVMAPIIILMSIQLGSAILAEASLSFLGLGPPPPAPTWGSMLAGSGRKFMESAPWLAIFPGIAISAAVLGFNLLGDALRDVLDPRLRGSS